MNSSHHTTAGDPQGESHHHTGGLHDMDPFRATPGIPTHDSGHSMSHDMSPDHNNPSMHDNRTHHDVGTHLAGDHGAHDAHGHGHHGSPYDDLLSLLNIGNYTGQPSCHGSICFAEQVIVVILPFLIIFGNVVTITVLLKTKSFRNCHGYYLLSLAVADFLMGPAALTAIFPVFRSYWPFGVTVCFLSAYIGEVCMKVSLLMLLLLSIERYIAICHPFRYTRLITTKTTVTSILVSWVLCNLIYIVTIPPGIICFTYASAKYMCTVTYFLHPEYVIGIVMTFLVPSLVVMTITSSLSSYRIFRSQILSRPTGNAQGANYSCEMRVHSKKNTRVFVVLVTLLMTFYVCWLPYVTINIYAYISGNTWDLNHHMEFYSYWLAVANSCLNPMIYFGLNKTFKRATVALMKKFLHKVTFGKLGGAPPDSIASSDQESKMRVISGSVGKTSESHTKDLDPDGICNQACGAEEGESTGRKSYE